MQKHYLRTILVYVAAFLLMALTATNSKSISAGTLPATDAAVSAYEPFDVPGAAYTIATGINSSGQIVGFYGVCNGTCTEYGFFRDRDKTFVSIEFPQADATNAYDISNSGEIVGTYFDLLGQRAFLLTNKGDFITIDFPDPAVCQTVALGTNSRGQVVGYYDLFDGNCDGPDFAFLRERDGTYRTLSNPFSDDSINAYGISPSGLIVGGWLDDSNPMDQHERAFLLGKNGEAIMFDYPGAADTQAFGINSQGIVTGFYLTDHLNTFGPGHGFVRDLDGLITELRYPGADKTLVGKINASNQFVGAYRMTGGNFHGFAARLR